MSKLTQKLGRVFHLRSKRDAPVEVDAEARSTPVGPSKSAQREATIQQLKVGYNEVVDTMQALRKHMEEQSERSNRLLTLMEDVPALLKSIPETNQNQTRVLEAIRNQMQSQSQSTDQLSEALGELAGATGRQQTAMDELLRQIDNSRASGEALRESLGTLSTSMQSMTDASRTNVNAINRIAEQTRDNQQHTDNLYRRTQKHATVMSAVSWALALVALAVAGYVAVMVSQVGSGNLGPAENQAANAPVITAGPGGAASGDAPAADASTEAPAGDTATTDATRGETAAAAADQASTDPVDPAPASNDATEAEPGAEPGAGETSEADVAAAVD